MAEFCCKSLRLRPCPSQRPPLSQYKVTPIATRHLSCSGKPCSIQPGHFACVQVGEAADALFRDIWWQGTVSHTDGGKVAVFLAGESGRCEARSLPGLLPFQPFSTPASLPYEPA